MNPKLSHPEITAQKIVTTWVAAGGIHNMDWTTLCDRITEALKEAIRAEYERCSKAFLEGDV